MVEPPIPDNPTKVEASNEDPAAALTGSERQRITLEEQYRAEVRKQLEEKRPNKSRVWTFLNSTFGLWLLSAIVISWAGTLYTQSQNRRVEASRKLEAERVESLRIRDLTERLDLELGYRLSQIQIQFAGMSNWMTGKPPFQLLPGRSEEDVKAVIDSMGQPPKGVFLSLYPEFSNSSTLALMAELRRHVSAAERDELDRVIADVSGIYIHIEVEKLVGLSDIDGVARTIHKDLTLQRWRKGRFYFSDCPFC